MMNAWLSGLDWLPAAGKWAVETSLAATGLALGLLLLRNRRLRWLGPRWIHGVGYLLLVRLMLPAVPTASWAWNGWFRTAETPVVSVTAVTPSSVRPLDRPTEPGVPSIKPVAPPMPEMAVLESAEAAVEELSSPAVKNEPVPAGASPWAWFGALWLTGAVGVMAATVLRHWWFFRGLRKRRRAVAFPWPHLPTECAFLAGWQGTVRVSVVEGTGSPSVSGLFRPVIVFPAETLQSLTEEEARHVLVHECLHLRHRDLWVNALASLAVSAHWFNPAIRRALRTWLSNREVIRDGETLRRLSAQPDDRQSYGRTLLKLAQPLSQPRPSPGLVVRMSSEKDIHRRIVMIAQNPTSLPRHRLLLAGTLAVAFSASLFTTAADTPQPPAPGPLPAAEPPPTAPTLVPPTGLVGIAVPLNPPAASAQPESHAATPQPNGVSIKTVPIAGKDHADAGASGGDGAPGTPAGIGLSVVPVEPRAGAALATPPPAKLKSGKAQSLGTPFPTYGMATAKGGGGSPEVQAQLDELKRGMDEIRGMLTELTRQKAVAAKASRAGGAGADMADLSAQGYGPKHPKVVEAGERAAEEMKALPPLSTPLPELQIELEMAKDELREIEGDSPGFTAPDAVRNAAKRRVERIARIIEHRQKLAAYEDEVRDRKLAETQKIQAERNALLAGSVAVQKEILELEYRLKGASGEKAEELQARLLDLRKKLIESEVQLKESTRRE